MALDQNKVRDLLTKRYGGAMWNPSAGNYEMSLREWLDRHPALQAGPEAEAAYQKATSAEGGQAWQAGWGPNDWRQGGFNPNANITDVAPRALMRRLMAGQGNTGANNPLGGPDTPPRAAATGPSNYKDYLSKAGKPSTWRTGAAFRMSQGKDLTAAQKRKQKEASKK